MEVNVIAARDLGITGIVHTSYDETRRELEALFGIDLT